MPSNVSNAGLFLLETLVSLYLTVLFIRFLMQWFRVDYFNPISQAIVKITKPVLQPFRSFIPNRGKIDFALLLVMFLIQALAIVFSLQMRGMAFDMTSLLFVTAVQLIHMAITTLIFAVIIRAVLSFIDPFGKNPFAHVMTQLTEPLMAPVRKVIPSIGGLDLSPLVVILGLQMLQILLGIR